MLSDEGFQQILNLIGNDSPSCLLPFGSRITPLKSGCEYLLRRHPRLMQCHSTVRANGILAQPRSGTCSAVQYDEDLPALGRDFDSKPGTVAIPIHHIFRQAW